MSYPQYAAYLLGAQSTTLLAVQADVATVKADVATVKADVSGVKTDVSGVKTDTVAIKARPKPLKQKIANLCQATTAQNTWYTVLSVAGKGILSDATMMQSGTTGNSIQQMEITIDGNTEVITSLAGVGTGLNTVSNYGQAATAGNSNEYFMTVNTPIEFMSSLVVRVRHTAAITVYMYATVKYALE